MGKRVLLIANEYTTIINFRIELVRAIIKEGHTLAVALPYHDRITELTSEGCKYYSLPIDRKGTNPLKDILIIRHISKIIRDFRPHIVFTFTIKPNVYGGIACAIARVPYVSTITGLGSSIQNGGFLKKISLALYKVGLRKAKMVLFQNVENRDLLLNKGIYSGAYEMIPGSGVNLEHFSVMDYPANTTLNFAFVSRLVKDKGIEEFIEAARYIKAKYPHTLFHICGANEGSYEAELENLEEKHVVVYHGVVKDMTNIYRYIHCIIHPSYHEGMANVLLESAACGRAIICSDIHGCMEAVDDGVNGFLVKVKDVESLKDKIEKFINLSYEEQKQMGLAGRKKMEKYFDRQIVVSKYLNEIN